MARLSRVLRSLEGGDAGYLGFWCPGCDACHTVRVKEGVAAGWSYNGNPEAPTFTPSILVTYKGSDAGQDRGHGRAPPAVCHSFVTDGQIQFLGDCTHALASQTVPLPDWDGEYGGT